jgi:hypothetical protein
MGISGVGSYNTSSISGDRSWSKASPADILADVRKLTEGEDGAAGGVKNYDFTSMTPKEMRGLADQLWRDGKIDLTQNFMLQRMGIPLGKLGSNGEFIPLTVDELADYENKPINYFEVGGQAMEFLTQTGKSKDPQYGYQNWEQILNVLNELQGSPKGIDVQA